MGCNRDRRDGQELKVEVVEVVVMYGSKVLKFELGVPRMKPFEEGNLVVMEKRPLEDINVPLALLCVCWRVVDVAGNDGLM